MMTWKASGWGLIEGWYSGILLEGLRRPTKTSVRIAGVPAEIRTEHFPNKSLCPYLLTNLFGNTHFNS
jgi:hypothetical protein